MFFCVSFHEVSNIITADTDVFKDQAHFTEFLFDMVRYMNIHFYTPKQTLILHLAQNSLQALNLDRIQGSPHFGGNESLQFLVGSLYLVPFTLLHLHDMVAFAANILVVGSGFFQQFYHRFLVFLVNFFSLIKGAIVTMPETAVKLINRLCWGIKSIDGKSSATNMFPCIVFS